MALDLSVVGVRGEVSRYQYGFRDVIQYALSVGARAPELPFLYEGRGPAVLPSFGVVPTLKPVFELLSKVGGDLASVVHGSQSMRFLKPFPSEGELETVAFIKGIYDLRRFATVAVETETSAGGELLCTTTWSIVYRGEGGFGGASPPREESRAIPDRAPDLLRAEATTQEQALLYRLNGDLNPLHADPEFAKKVGFEQPILHGLCTFGFMTRAVVLGPCGGDVSRLKGISGQFRKPVLPGDVLESRGWNLEDRWLLQVGVAGQKDPVVSHAYADIS